MKTLVQVVRKTFLLSMMVSALAREELMPSSVLLKILATATRTTT